LVFKTPIFKTPIFSTSATMPGAVKPPASSGTKAFVTPEDLAAATDDDPLIRWGAQRMRPGVRAWIRPKAVAVACADLSRRDRMVVWGAPGPVADLLRDALPEAGPTFRPIGDEALIAALADAVEPLTMVGRFAWMEVTAQVPATGAGGPYWLAEAELDEATDLIDQAFPDSFARPRGNGVHRWAGIRDDDGTLVAIAADAWSVPEVGFLAGVATRAGARGRGLASSVCSFVTNQLLDGSAGRVALLADYWNEAAVATYRRLGFTVRPLGAAHWR
jgi:GNAT superfamily N-acetyltransferase